MMSDLGLLGNGNPTKMSLIGFFNDRSMEILKMKAGFSCRSLVGLVAASLTAFGLMNAHWMVSKSLADESPTVDKPLERTRKTVRMLDDIYKGGIVAITDHYVNDKDAIPAGTAFKQIFRSAEEKGWHKVRLVDGLGEPINDENAPEDAFEKKALKALVSGKSSWYEQVESSDGNRKLRVATPIPVVFEKCIMCHDNYEDVPAGQAIGALTYIIDIE